MINAEHTFPTDEEALHAAVAVFEHARAEGRLPVLLAPDSDTVLAYRRALARAEAGFGITVTTLAGWTDDLWQLFGDGRAFVSRETRQVLLAHLARTQLGERATTGMVSLLAQVARAALSFIDQPAALRGDEIAAVDILRTYRASLRAANLIEPCEAYQLLALQTEALAQRYAPVFVGCLDAELPVAGLRFAEALGAESFDAPLPQLPAQPTSRTPELTQMLNLLYRRTPDDAPLAPTGAMRIAFPAGPSAEPFALSQAILSALPGRVVVAVKDPLALYDYCAPQLAGVGAVASVRTRVAVQNTAMGRVLGALLHLITDPALDTLLAADYALNPFTGMGYATAFFSDKTHRANRLIDANEVLTDLAGHADPALQGVIGLLEDGNVPAALDVLEAYANARFAAQGAYRAVQTSVIATARSLYDAGMRAGIPWSEALATLADMQVSVSAQNGPDPTVSFMTLSDAARLEPASCDAVIIGNLNAAHYPVRDPEGAAVTLLGKWNAAPALDPLGAMRRTFFHALATARTTVVLERTLHDENANVAQAAVAFEEALACYRTDLQTNADIDRATGLPTTLLAYTSRAGEQDLQRNAAGAPSAMRAIPAPSVGAISADARNAIVPPRYFGKETYPGVDLSASQIESYLECPYQWFAKRRLRLEVLEEGFTAVERGTFLHAVLERFYRRFQDEVAPKVTPETMLQAQAILASVFAQTVAEQPLERPGNRYVPINAWEQQVQADLLGKLQDALAFEARLLPTFAPDRHEWSYGTPVPFRYAGCNIVGRIDRIDVDSAGRAVVIDYKSSLSPAYRLHPLQEQAESPEEPVTFALPTKMQALIYAKVVRDTLGLNVVGTLYVNPLKQTVSGAWDSRVLNASDIPFATANAAQACAIPWADVDTFDALIDRSEELVAARMEHLAAGDVAPAPSSEAACEYCPVGNCPHRLVERKV